MHMKRTIWTSGIFALICLPVLTACNDDDDNEDVLRNNQNIIQTVTSIYPSAQIFEVEPDYQGYEVQMSLDGREVEMHLDGNYGWTYTEFEDMAWSALPEAVVSAFNSESYVFNPYEDDVDRIEYPSGETVGEYYRIELDREPADIVLCYNPDGSKRQP